MVKSKNTKLFGLLKTHCNSFDRTIILMGGLATWRRGQPYRWWGCRSWKWRISPALVFHSSLQICFEFVLQTSKYHMYTLKGTLAANSTLQTSSWKVLITHHLVQLVNPVTGFCRFPPNWKWCHPSTGTTLGEICQNLQKLMNHVRGFLIQGA